MSANVSGGKASFAGVSVPLPPGSALAGKERSVIFGVRPTAFSAAANDGWPKIAVTRAVIEDLGDER